MDDDVTKPISRVAVVNRGEAAVRLIHAVRELKAGRRRRTEVVALHTDGRAHGALRPRGRRRLQPRARPPSGPTWTTRCSSAHCSRAAPTRRGSAGASSPRTRRSPSCASGSASRSSARAPRRCAGSATRSAPSCSPRRSGSRSRRGATGRSTTSTRRRHAAAIGYPLMLKATAGGGGRGIRVVTSDDELRDAFERTRDEAQRVLRQRRGVPGAARHRRPARRGAGHRRRRTARPGRWACGTARCSAATRSCSRSPPRRCCAAEQVARLRSPPSASPSRSATAGPRRSSSCTTPATRTLAFLEVNTRLQVEHPVTELTTGVDLVKAQLHVAAAAGSRVRRRPSSGTRSRPGSTPRTRTATSRRRRDGSCCSRCRAGPGVRVDTGVAEGDTIPADFDSMIAKVIAYGRDRDEAMARLRRALADTHVVVEGGATNKSFLLDLLDQPEVVDGSADTGWIDRVRGDRAAWWRTRTPRIALVVAGIEALRGGRAGRAPALPGDGSRRPAAGPARARTGRSTSRCAASTAGDGGAGRPDRYRVALRAGRPRRRRRRPRAARRATPRASPARGAPTGSSPPRTAPCTWSRSTATTHRVSRDEGGVLRSPAPALVVAVPVEVGAEVEAGARVLVLESMKMETVLTRRPSPGCASCMVSTGRQVETGAPLVRLEPMATTTARPPPGRRRARPWSCRRPAATPRPATGAGTALARPAGHCCSASTCRRVDAHRAVAGLRAGRGGRRPHGSLDAELGVLRVFADLAELTRNRPRARRRRRRAGAQPARALPLLPAQPRHRPASRCRRCSGTGCPGCCRTTA